MRIKYDSVLEKEREKDIIPQLSTDPASPKSQDAWVLATISGGSGGGTPVGLLLALTTPSTGGSSSYAFKYRTKEGTTVSVALS